MYDSSRLRVNSLYMFRSLICSSSGGAVCTAIGIFCAYCAGWLQAGLEWNWFHSNPASKQLT
jgi:hypothetical protein